MGRKPKPLEEVKKRISIRLKKEDIEVIKKYGTLQEVIERLVTNFTEKNKK